METTEQKKRFEELREKAEKLARNNLATTGEKVFKETTELLHDLQVQQIELEMQNDELRGVQEELESSRDRFSLLYHKSPTGYITIDSNGIILEANHTMVEMLNTELRHMLGRALITFMSPDDQQMFFARFNAFFNSPEDKYLEVQLQPQKKPVVYVSLRGRIIPWKHPADSEEKSQLLVSVTDITRQKEAEDERMRLEKQLRHSQKMEAVGVLSGGIAHEFNNILYAILGYTEMLLEDFPELTKQEQQEYLNNVYNAGNRAKKLVRQILTYSRPLEDQREPVDAAPLIEEVLQLLRATLPTTIEIRQKIDFTCRPILADATQIHQVIMNLCTNARQAMIKDRGVLSISLQESVFEAWSIPLPDMKPGPYAQLTIQDTGCGIPPEMRDRIFDPFFTTKETGKGTGLGLSVVHGIIKNHQGVIGVESIIGQGTTFTVYFPIIEKKIQEKEELIDMNRHGNERILMVDDEEVLCQFYKSAFKKYGYQVTVTNNSLEAENLFCSNPDQFDMLISDQTMPNLTGDQLSRKCLSLKPNLPIILITGHSDTLSKEKAHRLGIRQYMIKPVAMDKLLGTVRKIFD
ncbi:MAG: response regulator [SAR324 cluster bacterium]|nr:response regulator [SAR324 cluster bacterium]